VSHLEKKLTVMTDRQRNGAPEHSGQEADASVFGLNSPTASAGAARPWHRAVLDRGKGSLERAKTGTARRTAGTLWSRLTAVDFMNSAFSFAALALLCGIPVLVDLAAAVGGSGRQTIITRMGLNAQAAKDVDGLFSSGQQAVATLTVIGGLWLVLSAFALASTLQGWYQRVYDQPPPHDWLKPLINRVAFLVGLIAQVSILVLIGRQVTSDVLMFMCELVVSTLFWWWAVHVLLLGQIGWRALFPTGLATAFCLTGLGVFSVLFFSSSVISDTNSYGPIGTLLGALSYIIGFAVCIHLGAVVGRMWNERHRTVTATAEVSTSGGESVE
jgi:membrane protein